MKNSYRFKALRARQADGANVFSITVKASELLEFSEIERVGRSDNGQLRGFQRHQISTHIKEIRRYLQRPDAILPNAVIVAFIEGAKVVDESDNVATIEVTIKDGKKPGFLVDGQQRVTALYGADRPDFELFASVLICKDYNELRQQFVLINNTRPLPRSLIYELLPEIDGLPERFSSRKFAARVVDQVNHLPEHALSYQIKQHTNPAGVISDTAVQKIVMNSLNDGMAREAIQREDRLEFVADQIIKFFNAVQEVWPAEWIGMSPRQSRLRHGAGIVALGGVMEELFGGKVQARETEHYIAGLSLLKDHVAWVNGSWPFSPVDHREWNKVQNTPSDIDLLTRYLVGHLRKKLKRAMSVKVGYAA